MAINLSKGQKINLSKEKQGLDKIIVGLGWDAAKKRFGIFGQDIDCDASAILLRDGKFVNKKDLVYFGNLKHKSGAVKHCGDNLTGNGNGDDEQIIVELSKVPNDVDRIVFVVNIYECLSRKQHFGMVKNAFIRVVDQNTQGEICRYNLSEDYAGCTAMIMGEVSREGNEWHFHALGQGTNDAGIGDLVNRFN
ncbi:TerD family protein [Lachnobacterium bovis]|uniref:Stress response protein SCP2 n=1 Tax=Lachnobacterium bovis TaxID=140626 RepID=A0A1H9RS97_9FIRM|nr:TerD family protein [Lachnobacterium bovis]SER75003.1 Stress response protein SCP2 [Lachnobacterium bovis]